MQLSELRSFGQRLRSLRVGLELSQAELARRIGRHQTAIGPYERDEYMPARDVVEKLAAILGASPEFLIFGRSAHRTSIPAIGRIAAAGMVIEHGHARPSPMLALRDEQLVGYEVDDGTMAPAYRLGQILLVAAISDERAERHLGRDVLAELQDGRILLRTLLPSRERGRFDLAANAAPTLRDVALGGVRRVWGALDRAAFAADDESKG